jgi:hypothetical protein
MPSAQRSARPIGKSPVVEDGRGRLDPTLAILFDDRHAPTGARLREQDRIYQQLINRS